jgi:DNA topoisomerase-3
VGVAYSRALGISGKDKKSGYIEGENVIITWCIGHLVGLANADVYGEKYKKWNIADLPIIPRKWEYVVSQDKNKQFAVVKKLMHDKRVTEIVFATDCGREGELIARLVYEKAGCKLPIKRAWLSSMENEAIVEAFKNLRLGSEFDNLYQSALCRSKADWIIGINATRLFTKLYNKKLNVGRVQTPTLAMIAERGAAISNFVKDKYFNVNLCNIAVSGRINGESEAEKIKSDCENGTAVVREVKRESKTVNPPRLFDLTSLQREANRLYGFTAQQTLDYAQSLYEMRLITYPRTDSQFLTDDMAVTANGIIGIVLAKIPTYAELDFEPNVERVIDSRKVADHFAIIPTAEIAKSNIDSLPDGERKVLLLIVNKLLCATANVHEYESVTATVECNSHTFITKSKVILNDGWKAIEKLLNGRGSDSAETALDLDLSEEQTFENPVCNITEHFTQPPKAFTEDSLLSAMQRAGQRDDVTEGAERSGLGTPATRAGIIEKLIKSGFVKRDKKNIVVTAEGAELVSLMPENIKSARMTAEWENTLSLIAKGEYPADKFMGHIETLTNEIITYAKKNVKGGSNAEYCNRNS